jgi:hypothetical protein
VGFHPFFPSGYSAITFTGFFGALSAALWAYDGWEDLNLVGSEVENPQRNIPRALIFGVLFCIVLFTAFSLAAHWALPFATVAQSPHVASDLVAQISGRNAALWVTLAMVISALGTLNASILSGARVPYAMARDGIFFRGTAEIHPRFRTPAGAILFELAISSIFTLTGTFEELTSLFLFATWIFYALAIAAMIKLRRTEPGLVRPYRCWGYPWVPAAFLAGAAALTVTLVAGASRSFVYRSRIDFFGIDFLPALAAKASRTSVIRSNGFQWHRLQPVGFRLCQDQNPQAEACATKPPNSAAGGDASHELFRFERQYTFLLSCMDCGSENSHPGGQARPGARKIAGSFDDKDAAVPRGRQIVPSKRQRQIAELGLRSRKAITARHYENHLRPRRKHRFPFHAERRLSLAPENIDPARALHHFRHPVPGHVQRIEPFKAKYARPIEAGHRPFDVGDASFKFGYHSIRLLDAARRFAHCANIRAHIRKRMGIERHDSRLAFQMRNRRAQIVRCRGAHMAEILRDDQVRFDRSQHFKINAVEAFAALEKFADLPVNRRGGLGM